MPVQARRALPLFPALLLALVAAASAARAQAEDPPTPNTSGLILPAPDATAIARAVAASPRTADQLVGAAAARDPSLAPELVGKAIAALPPGADADTAGRIAAAAAAAAPISAPQIAGAAAEAAALAAGRAVRPRRGATPGDATQAALTASATAAATVSQAVINAIGQAADSRVTAGIAAAVTAQSVTATIKATATTATEAATAAGATPSEAAILAGQATRLAASTVTQAVISAATAAVRQAAATDAAAAAARANASPEAMARTSAEAASLVANSVTQAAASAAAAEAGATPEDAQRLGQAAAVEAEKSVGGAATAATVAAVPVTAAAESLSVPPPPSTAASSSIDQRVVFTPESDSLLDHPERLVPAIFALLAFVTVVGLALPWLQPDIFKSRLKVITERRGELSQQRRQRLEMQRPSLRRLTSGRDNFMRAVLGKLVNLKSLAEQPELRKKLVRAGYRSPQSIITFTFLRLALPLGVAGFSALLLFGSPNVHMQAAFKVLIITGGVLVGFLLPGIMVSNAIVRRQQEIQRKFPDAIDLMVICIESGVSLEAAFARVSDEMSADAPALAEEIAITTAELAFLADRRQALDNLSERTGSQPIKSLVTSLIQSEKYGTPLGQALRVVAQEGRESRMALAEEKAAALPAKLTVPMVTFFLPVLFLVLIGPTIIQVMKAFSGGG